MAKTRKTLHLEKANENIAVNLKLKETEDVQFLDWQITIVFYACIHYINCYYLFHGMEPAGLHTTMKKDLDYRVYPGRETSKVKFSKDAYESYLLLSKLSEDARYKPIPIGPISERIKQQNDNLEKAEECLETVKVFIQGRGCDLS